MNRSLFFLLCLLPNLTTPAQQLSLKVGDRTITMDVVLGMQGNKKYGVAWVVYSPDWQIHFNTSLPFKGLATHRLMDYVKFFFDFHGEKPGFIGFIGGQYSAFIQQDPETVDGEEFVVESPLHRCFLILKQPGPKETYILKEMPFLDGQEILKPLRSLQFSTDNQDVYSMQTADQQGSDDHWRIICSRTGDGVAEKIVKGECVERHY